MGAYDRGFYFIYVKDENNVPIIKYAVSLQQYDFSPITIGDFEKLGINYRWQNARHLTNWIEKNKRNWSVIEKIILYEDLLNLQGIDFSELFK